MLSPRSAEHWPAGVTHFLLLEDDSKAVAALHNLLPPPLLAAWPITGQAHHPLARAVLGLLREERDYPLEDRETLPVCTGRSKEKPHRTGSAGGWSERNRIESWVRESLSLQPVQDVVRAALWLGPPNRETLRYSKHL